MTSSLPPIEARLACDAQARYTYNFAGRDSAAGAAPAGFVVLTEQDARAIAQAWSKTFAYLEFVRLAASEERPYGEFTEEVVEAALCHASEMRAALRPVLAEIFAL
jgi:hypothetical protein